VQKGTVLRERTPANLNEMTRLADQYTEARSGNARLFAEKSSVKFRKP